MLFDDLAAASERVTATRSRTQKVAALAEALRAAGPDEVQTAATYLGGGIRQRRTGVGWRSLATVPAPAGTASLTVPEVDAALAHLATLEGPGSQAARQEALAGLLGRATAREQQYLCALLTGTVRQGALAGLLVDAVAAASGVPLAAVRRAAMLAGSAPAIAATALTECEEGLAAYTVRVFTPVQPMLAASAPSVAEALGKMDPGRPVALEAKLDGIRIQAHKRGEEVRLYTRSLDEVTARLPGVVEAVRAIEAETLIVDGEALALDEDGRPRLFQDSASGAAGPLLPFFFDALLIDEEPLIDLPLAERIERLGECAPVTSMVQRTITPFPAVAEAFATHVLDQGHEGVVVKDLSAPYAAGRRGAAWLKVKPVHTLDLVVLAVEWGSGRRQGWLSNIHLGARDGEGGFVMLGKTFKGMTDEVLAWQTKRFLELETSREGYVVHVRPEQVVEIAFDGLQRSTRYPGGVALRFARVVRYRDDKAAAEADTIEDVRALAR